VRTLRVIRALRLTIVAAGGALAVTFPVAAKECPLYPLGISRAVIEGRNAVVSVASEEPLSSGAASAEMASAAARLAAKHALARQVATDGKTLSGVRELFDCVARGKTYSGVMASETQPVPVSESRQRASDFGSDRPAAAVAAQPVPSIAPPRADVTTRDAVRTQSAVDQSTISIGQSIRDNPTPTAETTDYEIVIQ